METAGRQNPDFLEDPELQLAHHRVHSLVSEGRAVLLVGEPGSGREALAQRSAAAVAPDLPTVVVRCRDGASLPAPPEARRGPLVVSEIEFLAGDQLAALADRLDDDPPLRLVLTVGRHADGEPSELGTLRRRLLRQTVSLPSLRERTVAIPRLLRALLSPARSERGPLRVNDAAMGYLLTYDWPGNLAELEGLAARWRTQVVGSVVTEDDLPPQIRWFSGRPTVGAASRVEIGFNPFAEEFQFRLIADALRRTQQQR